MRRIIRRREILEDSLRYAGEVQDPGTVAVQTAAGWIAGAGTRGGNGAASGPVALLLAATDEVEALAPHLQSVQWIVIEFAKIGEGRGYSQARLLRQRYGYAHELRARGALKRDQLVFLARCGFDAFDLDPAEDLSGALRALDSFTVAYQDGDEALVQLRRRAVPGAPA
jgi:uncharacterized protein (DUF934 family)